MPLAAEQEEHYDSIWERIHVHIYTNIRRSIGSCIEDCGGNRNQTTYRDYETWEREFQRNFTVYISALLNF